MRHCLLLLATLPLLAGDPLPLGGRLASLSVETLSGAKHAVTLHQPTVVVFYSALCPVSNEYNDRMSSLWREYSPKGVTLLFVNANQNEKNKEVGEHAKAAGFPFPVYRDRANSLADILGASLTPEAFLFDAAGILRYRGQIDDSRNPARMHSDSLRSAIGQVLANQPVSKPETKAFGCTIKRLKKVS